MLLTHSIFGEDFTWLMVASRGIYYLLSIAIMTVAQIGKCVGVSRAIPIYLGDKEKLTTLKQDFKSRRGRSGGRIAYICEDKRREHIILATKISLLANYISSLTSDKTEQITLASLYAVLQNQDGVPTGSRTGGWAKMRWKCRAVPLEDAASTYESIRQAGVYNTAVVLGTRNCVQTVPTV